jgi:hypothetical protein
MEKTGSVKWHQKINGSKCFKILAANHIANQDNSEDFNKALLDFLNTNNAVNTNGLNKS